MEQSGQQAKAGAGAAGATARSRDCAHLHSAFGPGCPHCWTGSTPPARPAAARPAAGSLDNQATAA